MMARAAEHGVDLRMNELVFEHGLLDRGLDPFEVLLAAAGDGEREELGRFVRMMPLDQTAQRLELVARGFDEHQDFTAALELALPPIVRLDARQQVDAGGQSRGQNLPSQLPGHGQQRSRDQDDLEGGFRSHALRTIRQCWGPASLNRIVASATAGFCGVEIEVVGDQREKVSLDKRAGFRWSGLG